MSRKNGDASDMKGGKPHSEPVMSLGILREPFFLLKMTWGDVLPTWVKRRQKHPLPFNWSAPETRVHLKHWLQCFKKKTVTLHKLGKIWEDFIIFFAGSLKSYLLNRKGSSSNHQSC